MGYSLFVSIMVPVLMVWCFLLERSRTYGKQDSNHRRLNDELGTDQDLATVEFYRFLDTIKK